MIKKMLIAFFALFAAFIFTEANATIDRSHVTLTNNTPDAVNVKIMLNTTDQSFKKDKDWSGDSITLQSYQSKQVLWFSRNENVKANNLYQFNLVVSNPKFNGSDVTLSLREKGKAVFGSELNQYLLAPGQSERAILENDGLYQYPLKLWNADYIVHARSFLPLGNVFDDFQFVIDKPDTSTFPTQKNTELSILTYNTQLMPFYTRVVNDLNQPELRAKEIPHHIKNYDVVVIEELFDRDLRSSFIEGMKDDYPYHTKLVGDTSDLPLSGGVMIFSKWPIEKEDQIIYQANDGVDALAAKGVSYAVINKNGKRYHVFGTHTVAGNADTAKSARARELVEFDQFIQRMAIPQNEPVLIAGDFNIDQFTDEVQLLLSTMHVNLLDNIGYKYSTDGLTDTMDTSSDRNRLDYVFYLNDHEPAKKAFNKVFVLRALENVNKWPKFDLSDHYPVASYFDFS